MAHQEFQENWKALSELIDTIPPTDNEHLNHLVNQYVEQNMIILNDVMSASIDNLRRLKDAKATNDIICTQARFTNEISKKLSLSTQRFLNASLGQVGDYNEWLKAHCDLATD